MEVWNCLEKLFSHRTTAAKEDIEEQLEIDLKMLSHKLSKIIFWPMNAKKEKQLL
jgi:hypothetical protein